MLHGLCPNIDIKVIAEKRKREKNSDPNRIRTGVLMNMQRRVHLEHHRAELSVFACPVKTLKLHRRVFPPVKNHP